MLEGVREADWQPGGSELAIVRRVSGLERLEFPPGKVLYQTGGFVSHMRFSPKGDRIAFVDHPIFADDIGSVSVIDLAGRRTVLLRDNRAAMRGLAWSPSGEEIWFTAAKANEDMAFWSVDLEGRERLRLSAPTGLVLFDVARDGRVLIGRDVAAPRGGARPRQPAAPRLLDPLELDDARHRGRRPRARGDRPERRRLRGDAAPGRRLASRPPRRRRRLRPLARRQVGPRRHAAPSPARRALPHGDGPLDRDAEPRAAHAQLPALAARRQDRDVRAHGRPGPEPRLRVRSADDGASARLHGRGRRAGALLGVPGLSRQCARRRPRLAGTPRRLPRRRRRRARADHGPLTPDLPIEWTADGRALFVARYGELPWRVRRHEIASGHETPWTEIAPTQLAGARLAPVFLTPDGRYWAHSYSRMLVDLYEASGIRYGTRPPPGKSRVLTRGASMAAPRAPAPGGGPSQGAPMASSEYQHIRFEVEPNGVATLTFNLPRMANAMDLLGVQETLDALRQCEKRSDVGAVVLTGAGEHAFSAGFNLKEIPFADWKPEEIRSHFETLAMWWHQVLHKIVHLPRPVLAAVNGVAAGVGLGMTLAADMAVAVDSATFLCAWHSIGLANDAATSYTLVKIVGFRRAMELMLTNRTLTAAEALDWQILNRVYPRADFQKNVAQIAADLAAGPTHLQAMAKSRFHAGWRQSIEECTELEIENVMESIADPYFKKTLDQFLSKQTRSDKIQVRLPPSAGAGVQGND